MKLTWHGFHQSVPALITSNICWDTTPSTILPFNLFFLCLITGLYPFILRNTSIWLLKLLIFFSSQPDINVYTYCTSSLNTVYLSPYNLTSTHTLLFIIYFYQVTINCHNFPVLWAYIRCISILQEYCFRTKLVSFKVILKCVWDKIIYLITVYYRAKPSKRLVST